MRLKGSLRKGSAEVLINWAPPGERARVLAETRTGTGPGAGIELGQRTCETDLLAVPEPNTRFLVRDR